MQPAARTHITPAWRCCLLLLLAACGGPSGGNSTCDGLPRDQCRQTVGCFLDYGGQPNSYSCRPAQNDCELLTNSGGQSACETANGCTWSPGACYCPEGVLCFCGGGPPPMCRQS